jgi:hypothetical protein
MDNASLNAMYQDRHEADAYRRIELTTGTVRSRWTNEEEGIDRRGKHATWGQYRGSRAPVRCQSWAVADVAAQGDR